MGDGAGGVAGGNRSLILPDQAADGAIRHRAGVRGRAGDAGEGIAGPDFPEVVAHQPARMVARGDRPALDIAGDDAAVVGEAADQRAHVLGGAHAGVDQRHLLNVAVADDAEQAHKVVAFKVGFIDVQVGDGIAVAVEPGGVSAVQQGGELPVVNIRGIVRQGGAAEGLPALAAVVVVVVGAVAGRAGVEVQGGHQLVALAGGLVGGGGVVIVVGGDAAHSGGGAGVGGLVAGGIGAGGGGTIAVQVVADGVELGQGPDVNEAVVVAVEVHCGGGQGYGVGFGVAVGGGDGDGDGVAAAAEFDLVAGAVGVGVGGYGVAAVEAGVGCADGHCGGDDALGHGGGRGGDGDGAGLGGVQGSSVGGGGGGEGGGEGGGREGQGGQVHGGAQFGLAVELVGGVMSAVFEGGVLGIGAEVPGVVQAASARSRAGIAVQVEVPVGVDAGRRGGAAAVGGGRAQLVGQFAGGVRHSVVGGAAGAEGVPVAVGHAVARPGLVAAHDAAGVCAAAFHRAGGVTGGDIPVVLADQAAVSMAGRDAGVDMGVFHLREGVAGGDVAGVLTDQAADVAQRFQIAALDIAGDDAAGAALQLADQGADSSAAAHIRVQQAQVFQPAAAFHDPEQADASIGVGGQVADVQVGDGMAVAVKAGGVGRPRKQRRAIGGVAAQGYPALAAVVELVVGADAGRAGVKVQVGAQFVAFADGLVGGAGVVVVVGGNAAHSRGGAGEGGVVAGLVAGGYRAVAVQVPADGVELGEGADVDESVVIVVEVHGGGGGDGGGVAGGGAVGGGYGDGDGGDAAAQGNLVSGEGGAGVGGYGAAAVDGGVDGADGGHGGAGGIGGGGGHGDAGGGAGAAGVGGGGGGEGGGQGYGGGGQGGEGAVGGDGGLAGELGRRLRAMPAVLQRRILRRCAEVPGVVQAAGARAGAGIAVQVEVPVGVGVDVGGVGGGGVGGGGAEFVG